ncbi:MAG: phosphoribosylformylglycinamidine synthase [Candidatus Limiplasma sp.]|nr:phosphoribosylformylglycinamidine synthase [Candidatus Limiplasma sp.]
MAVIRLYVEKKAPYAVEAQGLLTEVQRVLGISGITGVRILNRYDVEGLDTRTMERCKPIVFMEPPLDEAYDRLPQGEHTALAVEALPGQFDPRAASCQECIQLLTGGELPRVDAAKVYLFSGTMAPEDFARIKEYLINPVEAREADLDPKRTLARAFEAPEDVPSLEGFREMTGEALSDFVKEYGLAMDERDLAFCRDYFRGEGRDPSLTELRVLDTYWSDHCRHTTFGTELERVRVEHPAARKAFARYLSLRERLYAGKEKPITLMDIATIGAKELKRRGLLGNLDESQEINACSIRIDVDVEGKAEPWLLMFKNETHNHPTEIEPFGGAATCLGGAIRDPLSGRAYVYQAMRITGAADPTGDLRDTLPGKLPQRKITTTAAAGYSAYGNQVGLATGLVKEIYHPGYAAKRLELGAVLGAAPAAHVRREEPAPGDVVILLGGRTGRDGCGGATGSSKSHSQDSAMTCGAQVQKGNPVVERKLQRLFRDDRATRLIKRCNDFGAGGVSVAIGEVADGLIIDLDRVPKKYEGLDGTELAISESQERMAVVVAPQDVEAFVSLAQEENLEATPVAWVTEQPRLVMRWRGRMLVDLSREFVSSNGAKRKAEAAIGGFAPWEKEARAHNGEGFASFQEQAGSSLPWLAQPDLASRLEAMASDLNICGQKGLTGRFDSTIGGGTALMPLGGKYQLTPIQCMVAKIPVPKGETDTVSGMSYGFHPHLSSLDPYEGAYLAVVESLAKLAAAGFDTAGAYLTFQEYFERMTGDAAVWGKPLGALLGALDAQLDFGVAAIGGKDSMSGTFESLTVPPTLVSFAVAPGKASRVISPEFKGPGHALRLLTADAHDAQALKANWALACRLIGEGKVLSAWALGLGGIAEALLNMALGNGIGAELTYEGDLFAHHFGGLVLEMAPGWEDAGGGQALGTALGRTIAEYQLAVAGKRIPLGPLQERYESKLASVFPYRTSGEDSQSAQAPALRFEGKGGMLRPRTPCGKARPMALIPAFPGTNCETDTARALERAGARAEILLIRNQNPSDIAQSLQEARRLLARSQIIVVPGGFSGGDEPDGSAKLIAAFFRNPAMGDGVRELLHNRDGLILGICNGFQALVKLGLLPFGEIAQAQADWPTLTFNTLGRHQSMLVTTRISSILSPWLQRCALGQEHTIAISHGEGRFVAPPQVLERLIAAGQIAAQYVDGQGNPTMDPLYNPNGSVLAIEAITSPDGRILGKMGHSERAGRDLYKNVEGNKLQPLFEGGVA